MVTPGVGGDFYGVRRASGILDVFFEAFADADEGQPYHFVRFLVIAHDDALADVDAQRGSRLSNTGEGEEGTGEENLNTRTSG